MHWTIRVLEYCRDIAKVPVDLSGSGSGRWRWRWRWDKMMVCCRAGRGDAAEDGRRLSAAVPEVEEFPGRVRLQTGIYYHILN